MKSHLSKLYPLPIHPSIGDTLIYETNFGISIIPIPPTTAVRNSCNGESATVAIPTKVSRNNTRTSPEILTTLTPKNSAV